MPGRKKQKLVERRTPCLAAQPPGAHRPKRHLMPKKTTDTEGISWKEEKMLQKALYASLHPETCSKTRPMTSHGESSNSTPFSTSAGSEHTTCAHSSSAKDSLTSASSLHQRNRQLFNRLKQKPGRKRVKLKNRVYRLKSDLQLMMSGCVAGSGVGGESTGTNTPASQASNASNLSKGSSAYKAQRKFAQGSKPTSPSVSPVKYPLYNGASSTQAPSPVKYMLKNPPKTEDFLTFLCLRGTNLLPKELEFFNYCDPELLRAMNTPQKGCPLPGTRALKAQGMTSKASSPGHSRVPSPQPSTSAKESEDSKAFVTRAYASCSVPPAPAQSTTLHSKPNRSESCASAAAIAATTSATSQSQTDNAHSEDGASSSSGTIIMGADEAMTSPEGRSRRRSASARRAAPQYCHCCDLSPNKGSPKKFVSKSPTSSHQFRHEHLPPSLPGVGDSVTSSYQASSEDSSQDSTSVRLCGTGGGDDTQRSATEQHTTKTRIKTETDVGDDSGATTMDVKCHVNKSDDLQVPKDVLRSVKAAKKDNGHNIIKKAKADFVAKQIQLALESQQRDKKESRRGMLTRRRHDQLETEKFTEARLESLYAKPTATSAAGACTTRSGAAVKSSTAGSRRDNAAVSRSSPQTIASSIPPTDRQTRNTPAKLEARCAQKQALHSKRGGSVDLTQEAKTATPVKKTRRSAADDSNVVVVDVSSSDEQTPTPRRNTRSSAASQASNSPLPSAKDTSGRNTPLAALNDLDLPTATLTSSTRSLRFSSSPCRPATASASGAAQLQMRESPASRGRSPCSVRSESSSGSARKAKLGKRLSLRQLFPNPGPEGRLQAPTYHPSPEQFLDPMTYIESIRMDAEPYGMCCIVPPEVWKPECCVSQELRFITEIQHLHKMKERWGPNVEQMECIRKHLSAQNIRFDQPVVGGLELDLPALSRAIRQCGGISTVADDKRKWQRVADLLHIPEWAQDRSFKLYDCYCKYMLSYDTLSSKEKEKLTNQLLVDKRKGRLDLECVLKGKSRSLAEFFNLARSTLVRWFKSPPSAEQVEEEYWRIVGERTEHVAVHCAHVDTKNCGGGFPTRRDSPYSRHGWNFNELQHNDLSVLRQLGLVSGVTIPELHMGMLFSTNCWCSDPHGLPYISYLHTGSDIVWYCIPRSEEARFKEVLMKRAPDLIDADSPIWLPVDSIMLSAEELAAEGVRVCRLTQRQGEFMVVFPQSFTATICCGYNISESIRFATCDWIDTGLHMAKGLQESCEPELFSMERLLLRLARTDKTTPTTLSRLLPGLTTLITEELAARQRVLDAGVTVVERLKKTGAEGDGGGEAGQGRRKRSGPPAVPAQQQQHELADDEQRCDVCKKICYFSMVVSEPGGVVYSLDHALPIIQRRRGGKSFRLVYRYSEKELRAVLEKAKERCGTRKSAR